MSGETFLGTAPKIDASVAARVKAEITNDQTISDPASVTQPNPTRVRLEFDDLKELLPLAAQRLKQSPSNGIWKHTKETFPILTPVAAVLISFLTFYYGHQFNNRDARLKAVQQKFEEEKYDAGQWPALQLRIRAEQESLRSSSQAHLLGKDEHLIRVFVTVENVGTSKTKLDLSEGPLLISKVLPLKNGRMQFEEPRRFWLMNPSFQREEAFAEIRPFDEMRPKATDQFEFLANVKGRGLYALMFYALVDKPERQRMEARAKQNDEEPWNRIPRWDAITYFEVK